MGASQFLFDLLKSLSPAEKRYHSLFSQRMGKGKNQLYAQLFVAVDAQEAYDEESLKAYFQGTSFGKSLAFPKTHLYQQVLRSLQAYHYEKTPALRLRSCLNKVDLLADRGLEGQALRLVGKGLKEAEAEEETGVVLELLARKRQLLLKIQGPDFATAVVAVAEAEMAWEEKFMLSQRAQRVHDALYARIQQVRRKNETHSGVDLKALIGELDGISESRALTFETQILLFRARQYYHHLLDDFPGAHAACQGEMEVWQAHPIQLKNQSMRYIRAFGSWLNWKILIGDEANFLQEIQRLREVEVSGKAELVQIFRLSYALELFYYLNARKFRAGLSLLAPIQAGLDLHRKRLSSGTLLGFWHNLAVLCWLGEEPGQALPFVQRILQASSGESRRDIRAFAPLLEKILFYELGHSEALESWFRSVRYRSGKEEGVGQLELLLCQWIRTLLTATRRELWEQGRQDFQAGLQAYLGQPETARLGLEELQAWSAGLSPEFS